MKRVCPHCAQFIDRKLEICPACGKPVKSDRVNVAKKDRDVIVKTKKPKKDKSQNADNKNYGTIHISTSESIYYNSAEYSAKKARGEYQPEKLKWWEIYKWADRVWVKRKINKVVNKNSNQPPENLSYVSMLILTLLIGFSGLNNIYAKNYRRGITMLSFFSISLLVVGLTEQLPFLLKVQYSLGGLLGFVVLIMWLFDIFRVVFKKYVYKTSKLEYIRMLDIETRAKLGKKYIDLNSIGKKLKKSKKENNEDKAVA